MNKNTRNRLIGIAIVIVIFVAMALFESFRIFTVKLMNFADFKNEALGWLCFIVFLSLGAYSIYSKRETFSQAVTAFFMAVGHWIFLKEFYYGWFTDYVVATHGTDPRFVLFWQTLGIMVAAAIIYYMVVYVFEVKPNAWKAYALISFFGPILIAGMMYSQPYSFFEHLPKDKDGNPAQDVNGNYEVRSKFWLLKNEDGDIIDLSYSPGVSESYGKQLVRGTPGDVEQVRIYLQKNSKIPLLYGSKKPSDSLGDRRGKKWQTVFSQSYIGQGNNEIKIAEAGKDVIFGNKIIITGKKFQLWKGGKWVEHIDHYEIINKYTGGRGNFFKAKVPRGDTIIVKSQRLM